MSAKFSGAVLSLKRGSTDLVTVRPLFLLLAVCAGTSAGESYPASWNYVPRDASALVGLEWRHLSGSLLGEAFGDELTSDGHLGFPDLECLRAAREILLSGPDLLAIASGDFPSLQVELQAASLKMKRTSYKGAKLWIAASKNARSLAQINDNLLLVGYPETLEAAIDRSLQERRDFSPLLTRAAQLSALWDFWIVGNSMPDPLVHVFVPLELETAGFDAGLRARNGLQLEARYVMGSTDDAVASAEFFRRALPEFHAITKGMYVIPEGEQVRLLLDVSAQELAQQLRPPEPPPPAPVQPVEPEKPKVMRIFGLDEGTRVRAIPAR
jgi:hypothetical protein